ncbi:sugar phosphate isomerase/epimerase family protein [Halomonas dongshanensis]|uniref:Sugar phosphate isomerase/epimerase n=1 Tax=Halomonas dongshanensis TaxID=2890835 RepID=A0ABT2EAP9_9GAMM|nr:sugar phosphate isomerase/epimerase family protein [Halomonas dongshanensis]MCS2608646.1 sugar phosphate isomerase/epimerase [Halomonas dongshanensis]
MNIGIRAHDLPKQPLDELGDTLSMRQLNIIQLALGKSFDLTPEPGFITPGLANHIRRSFSDKEVRIAVLGCYVNIIHPDRQQRKQALSLFKEHLKYARDFGCSIVGTETGNVNAEIVYTEENFTESAFSEMVESVQELVQEAEKFGVIVGIEPGINHPLHSADKVRRLVEAVPSNNLQIIFDPVNLLTSDNYRDQQAILETAIHQWGDKVAVLHAKDFIVEDGKLVFVPLGQGWLDYQLVFDQLIDKKPYIDIIMDEIDAEDIEAGFTFIRSLVKSSPIISNRPY